MEQNLVDELDRINNIDVIEPPRERPSTPVRQRLKTFGKEAAQLKQYVTKISQQMEQQHRDLCQKLDNLTTAQIKPKSILVAKCEDDQFVTPPATPSFPPSSPCLSRASSSRLSRASSRLSPEREQGILPVMQNLLVANKYLLKEKRDKYPEALSGIRRHINGRETVANRMQKDAELIEAKITETLKYELKNDLSSEIASLIPLTYGLEEPDSFQTFIFHAIPESEADFALEDSALKTMLKTHFRIENEGDQIRHLIQDLIQKYTGRLTASQFKNIVISMCKGSFRDLARNALKDEQLNRAISTLLRMYGNIKSENVKISIFFNSKVDHKNLKASLIRIWEAAMEAYPELNKFEIVNKAINQAIRFLPLHVQNAVLRVQNKLKERHEINPKVPLLDYHQFIDLVEQHLSKNDGKSGKGIQTKDVSEMFNDPDFSNID